MASYFVTSFTASDHRGYAARFKDDLAVEVGRQLGGRKITARTCDDALTAEERGALVAETRVLVVLCSPAYFDDQGCGRDWAVFQRRLGRIPEQGQPYDNAARVLVRWRPVGSPPRGLPGAPLLDGDEPADYDDYNEHGLYTVVRKQGRQSPAYRHALRVLAAKVREGHRISVPVLSPGDGPLPDPAFPPVTLPHPRTETPVAQPDPEPARLPRAFISFAHDDHVRHGEDVVALAELLRQRDINARTDHQAAEEPQIWRLWMTQELEAADYILTVASPEYRIRAEQRKTGGIGLGATWEGSYVLDEVYANPLTWVKRVIRVVLPSFGPEHLPVFPGSTSATYYRVDPDPAAAPGHGQLDALVRYLKRGPAPS